MDPVTAGVVGGSALAQMGGSIYATERNIKLARENRRWQERMANTAHQRQMADLKKAGLNPLLTGKYGGSSTPSGNVAQVTNPMEGMGNIASAYSNLRQQRPLVQAQVDQVNAVTDKTSAEAELIRENVLRQKEYTPLELDALTQKIDLDKATTGVQRSNLLKVNKEIERLEQELKRLRGTGKLYDAFDKITPPGKKIADELYKIDSMYRRMGRRLQKEMKSFRKDPGGWLKSAPRRMQKFDKRYKKNKNKK